MVQHDTLAVLLQGDHVLLHERTRVGDYSEVVLYKVVHTPQMRTQPNPFKDKALSTSQKNAYLM